jgi:hypothetical protein
MQVTALTSASLPSLFEFWYDLEVLRAQLFRLPSPALDAHGWVNVQTAWLMQDNAVGLMCDDGEILGAIGVTLQQDTAQVCLFVVDLHTPHRRAVGKILWDALKSNLQSRLVKRIRASAKHQLPIEAAFWQANRATKTDTYWEVLL